MNLNNLLLDLVMLKGFSLVFAIHFFNSHEPEEEFSKISQENGSIEILHN